MMRPMPDLSVEIESWPIAGSFTISRGAKTAADVVTVTLKDGAHLGRGECVPYRHYGETLASVTRQIDAVADAVQEGLSRNDLLRLLPPGAARNALDCAIWDLEAKWGGTPVWQLAGLEREPAPVTTAYTLSLGTPDEMFEAAKKASHCPLLKVKLGQQGDLERLAAIREAAPDAKLIADANEGWRPETLESFLSDLLPFRLSLIEQPVPAKEDSCLAGLQSPIPLCADESCHTSKDMERLAGLYDVVNIKLDKTGGLTEALRAVKRAREQGLAIMVGCMVGTSLAMAPAVLIAQGAAFVDLDGPLLLAKDREPGLHYEGSLLHPPEPQLWG